MKKEIISTWLRELQEDICQQLEAADGKGKFVEDAWERPGGGGGYSRVIEGQHIEKGGVNFSAIHGMMPKKISDKLGLEQATFFATGVSIVLHPQNPMVPIIHMNVRYFEMDNGIWWFGGGIDLTPHYVNEKDAQTFHRKLKKVCDNHHPEYYPKFKEWADNYFYVRHRKETRGIGGIFFDRLDKGKENEFTKAQRFDFLKAVGKSFCDIYIPMLEDHKNDAFGEQEKNWQYLRRGRYVEFNLVWDKGTKFGLDTDGRTESILMSLPPMARWQYMHQPTPGSREAKTLACLVKEKDWITHTIS